MHYTYEVVFYYYTSFDVEIGFTFTSYISLFLSSSHNYGAGGALD